MARFESPHLALQRLDHFHEFAWSELPIPNPGLSATAVSIRSPTRAGGNFAHARRLRRLAVNMPIALRCGLAPPVGLVRGRLE